MRKVDRHLWEPKYTQPLLQKLVELHRDDGGIVLPELFVGFGTGLAAPLEAGLSIHCYLSMYYCTRLALAAKVIESPSFLPSP